MIVSTYLLQKHLPYIILCNCLLRTKTLDIRTTGDGAENDNAEQVLELTITTKEGTDIINPKWVIMFNLHGPRAGWIDYNYYIHGYLLYE